MPFKKDDPATIAAAKRGGTTGKKHLATVSKAQQRKFGKASGKRRRELAEQRGAKTLAANAEKYEQKIMKNYLV